MKKLTSCLFVILLASAFANAEPWLADPEWTFTDDFEGEKDSSFWLGAGVYVDYGVEDPTDASNKVMKMRYVPNSEGAGDSWSEYDFELGIKAVQLVMRWRQYVPADYHHIERNHKVFALWSGPYGKIKANLSVSSEAWGSDAASGALPSVYVGVDGSNFAHSMNTNKIPVWEDGEGRWITMHVYLELAEEDGDHGVMSMYKDGQLITGTHTKTLIKGYDAAPIGPQLIKYSHRGNFIDQGTLLGWANGDEDGGFRVVTEFLIDDFQITANSIHGDLTGVSVPTALSDVVYEAQQ